MDFCHACKKEIRVEDIVVCCEGFCEDQHYIHARCAGLTYDEGCACLNSNILWVCDTCRKEIENRRIRKPSTALDMSGLATRGDVDSLKTELDRISKIVSQLTSNPSSTEMPVESPDKSLLHQHDTAPSSCTSSPLTSTRNQATDHVIHRTSQANNNSHLQLFISNIASDVTDDELGTMVCGTLGTDHVLSVKRLVSPWKDTSTLEYVSFKVIVNEQYRNCALNLSNWPTGVRCREFKNYSYSVWRPMRIT